MGLSLFYILIIAILIIKFTRPFLDLFTLFPLQQVFHLVASCDENCPPHSLSSQSHCRIWLHFLHTHLERNVWIRYIMLFQIHRHSMFLRVPYHILEGFNGVFSIYFSLKFGKQIFFKLLF
jgi:hypothetical protein